jgi:hypothetical protein
LLLIRSIALWGQLISIDPPSLQSYVVQSILVRNIDILLGRHQFDLNVSTNTLNGPEIDRLNSIRAFRSPGEVVATHQLIDPLLNNRGTDRFE